MTMNDKPQTELFGSEETRPAADVAQMRKRLIAMGSMGMNRAALCAFAEVFAPGLLTLDDSRYLRGPVVVHQNGWTETLPDWLPAMVSIERAEIVFAETSRSIVGPAEIAAVMYPATMAAPMYSDYADLYIWATVKAHSRRKAISSDDAFRELGSDPITDASVLEPRGRLFETFRYLAQDIRRRVIAAQTERDRADARQAKAQKPVKPANPARTVEAEQFTMFVSP
jgi:hypothetical protein